MTQTSELTGKFHVHLTLACTEFNKNVKGWKTTIILLSKEERSQLDVMLTKHYYTPSLKTTSLDDIKVDIAQAVDKVGEMGYKVVRVKLEHESLPTLQPSLEKYRECHIKMKIPKNLEFTVPKGFVKSSNPISSCQYNDVFFVNKRYYSGDIEDICKDVDDSVELIKLQKSVEVLEVKQESIVFDTNKQQDNWWA